MRARIPKRSAPQKGNHRCTLQLRVQPGAKTNTLLRRPDGQILARVQAQAANGKANADLRRFIARTVLGIPQSKIRIIKGEKSRNKNIEIDLDQSTFQTLLHKYLDA